MRSSWERLDANNQETKNNFQTSSNNQFPNLQTRKIKLSINDK